VVPAHPRDRSEVVRRAFARRTVGGWLQDAGATTNYERVGRVEASGDGTTRVRKDPPPSVDRIEALASRILTKDILLPKVQRSFVWERPQIISLLDSVGPAATIQ
jgi:hypothetical protein